MDGITGMEGRGPGQGTPVNTGVLIGSSNPLGLDIIATAIAGYNPLEIPTNKHGLSRKIWLSSAEEINYDGPDLKSLIKKDFKRIPVTSDTNISFKFIKNRVPALRRLERRPEFIHENCTGCRECIKICPQNAIVMHHEKKNHVVLSDKKCIRCFCCSEVCKYDAVKVRIKLFGV
jgi:ferredoxin